MEPVEQVHRPGLARAEELALALRARHRPGSAEWNALSDLLAAIGRQILELDRERLTQR